MPNKLRKKEKDKKKNKTLEDIIKEIGESHIIGTGSNFQDWNHTPAKFVTRKMHRTNVEESEKKLAIADYANYGQLGLEEYGFGSWLKENAGGMIKGAGSLVNLIPGFGKIAGPLFDIAGAAITGNQEKRRMEADSLAQQKEFQTAQAEEQRAGDLAIKRKNLVNDDINYGSSIQLAHGGQIGDIINQENPVVRRYSKKTNKHNEGIGGFPVDEKGNAGSQSGVKVGELEEGEITIDGFVFSASENLKFEL